jgi:membrane-bound lytic murein transglycosylase B
MVTKYHFNKAYISKLIYSVKIIPKPIRAIKHPYEAHPWYIYRRTFVNNDRINAGVAYWQRNKTTLRKAERKYDIPAGVIVAIVGVESHYGKQQGNYSILNALVTLAFTQSIQREFFQYELEQYFLMTRELKLDPRQIRGSYGGAMGFPQFTPSSFRRFAIDFNKDNKKDLFHDTADVIGSIANFLNHYGWQKNEPIMVRAIVTGDKYKKILNNKFKPQFTIAELKKYNIKPSTSLPYYAKVNLIRLQDKQGYEFWLALHNFYVMIHYNVSTTYAMAIYQLADEIHKAYIAKLKQAFIKKMITYYHFDRNYVTKLINKIQFLPKVIEHMEKPYEKLDWYIYSKILITDERIQEGAEFWQQHAKILAKAQKTYGLPPSIIVAIIGIESNYGQSMGKYSVLNALGTLAFDYPRRLKFFQSELRQYLLLTKELKLNPLALNGSYAGAMGYPQFMPSSYRNYAMHKNLFHNINDAIVSVAYYLEQNGWQHNGLITVPAKVTGNKYSQILNNKVKPKYTMISELKKYGVKPRVKLANNRRVNLIRFKTQHGHEYWLGLHNFYVITTYNHSAQYAMAVYQLAEKIKNFYYAKNSAPTSSSRRS